MSVITPYKPQNVSFTRGEGIWLWDENGDKYLDALAGIAVCNLGHCHPDITEVIAEQSSQLIHTSNLYTIPLQFKLAEQLVKLTRLEQVFFANSGAEANEAAIKLARLFGHERGIENPAIVVTEKAFHGRTMATVTASGSRKVQAGFEPLLPGFVRAPYDDIDALKTIAANNQNIVAILVEPIQGEGGVNLPNPSYLSGVREVCDEFNWLMMLDEVQTGIGRTGELFCYQHHKLSPDVVTSAKGLGNGFPVAACIIGKKAKDVFKPGKHGSTFGGNPLACAVASKVLDIMSNQQIPAHAAKMGHYFMEQAAKKLQHPKIVDIRGQGLMIGIEFSEPCAPMWKLGLEQQLLFSVTAENVVRLLPPLVITKDEIDELIERLNKTFAGFSA